MTTLRPVNSAPLRRSVIGFTLRSGLPGTNTLMLRLSSDGVNWKSGVDSLARYWKQRAARFGTAAAFWPVTDPKASLGEPSSGTQLFAVQSAVAQLADEVTR